MIGGISERNAGPTEATRERRSTAWARAARLGHDRSVWCLELVKLDSESGPGFRYAGRGRSSAVTRIARQAAFVLATLAAAAALCGWLLWFARRAGSAPAGGQKAVFVALNGEWSNRTRHVLEAMGRAPPPQAIVITGRLRHSPARIAADWSTRLGCDLPPAFCPVSLSAALAAVPDMVALAGAGLRCAGSEAIPFYARLAMGFRVLLGAVSARWWQMEGPAARRVVFGFTGLADSTLLERAMQERSSETVHAVHGLATGPDFAGFSDVAIFRCGHDAAAYARLGCYGSCTVQPAPAAGPRRGGAGLLLLTNLAHPMNRHFRDRGEADEIAVLARVAEAARLLGPPARPLCWKPHPVIASLPTAVAGRIRDVASGLGFEELPHGPGIGAQAARFRWVVSTPSTITADFMVDGVLCLVLDPQGTCGDDAPALLPRLGASAGEIAHRLRALDDDDAFGAEFARARDAVGPAAPLDLAPLLGQGG